MSEEIIETTRSAADYSDSSIRHLDDMEHIRLRPGMYIGRLGDGSQPEDGIYVLLKESIDNSIDEFNEGFGKKIEVDITDTTAAIRDYGRGIPLGSLIPAVSKLNTGGKYDNDQYTASVGLNGVGLKAVNALALRFTARSTRDGEYHEVIFERGHLVSDKSGKTEEDNGTYIAFEPDPTLFTGYRFRSEYVKDMLRNYTYLNAGLAIFHNGQRIISRNGLEDLLSDKMSDDALYPIVHIKGEGIEIAFTHATKQNGEEYYSFVNGQYTTQGGTHQAAFKEHIAKTIKEYSGKNFEVQDVRNGLVAAIAVRRGGHHTSLVTGGDQNFRTALRSGQFEKLDLVVAKKFRVIAVTAHFVLFFRRAAAGNGQHDTRNHIIYQSCHNRVGLIIGRSVRNFRRHGNRPLPDPCRRLPMHSGGTVRSHRGCAYRPECGASTPG